MPNAFVHVELMTNDVAKAKSFYGQLFSWKLDDVPMPDGSTYTMIGVDEGTGGGGHRLELPLREADVERHVAAVLEAQLPESCLEPLDGRVTGRPRRVEDADPGWAAGRLGLGGDGEEAEKDGRGGRAEESPGPAPPGVTLRRLHCFTLRRVARGEGSPAASARQIAPSGPVSPCDEAAAAPQSSRPPSLASGARDPSPAEVPARSLRSCPSRAPAATSG